MKNPGDDLVPFMMNNLYHLNAWLIFIARSIVFLFL